MLNKKKIIALKKLGNAWMPDHHYPKIWPPSEFIEDFEIKNHNLLRVYLE